MMTSLLTSWLCLCCLYAGASSSSSSSSPASGASKGFMGHHAGHTSLAVERIMRVVHKVQHPPKSACKSQRLLVTRLDNKFEGLASVILQIMMGVAEAVHSNRTLIFGPDLPYLFQESRPEWVGVDGLGGAPAAPSAASTLRLPNGTVPELDCSSWVGRGGGPFACFFLPLSSCTLLDLSPGEMEGVGRDGFSDSGRVRLMEARRGVGVYHAPTWDERFGGVWGEPSAAFPDYTWAASLAAYVFRLRPNVEAIVEARRGALLMGKGIGASLVPSASALPLPPSPLLWGIHVRNGDIKALATVYTNRKVFTLEEMLRVAGNHSRHLGSSSSSGGGGGGGATPHAIFVASDGPSYEWLEDMSGEEEEGEEEEGSDGGMGVLSVHAPPTKGALSWKAHAWWGKVGGVGPAPVLLTPGPQARYRTPYGSHTVAANGGCAGDTCALPADVVLSVRADHSKANVPSSASRVMRVLGEAMEDLYLLSFSQVFVSQGSSLYSTVSAMLSWARAPNGPNPASVIFLDTPLLTLGRLQSGFLQGGLNGTTAPGPGREHERWIAFTKRFIEGISPGDTASCGGIMDGYLFQCDRPHQRMRLEAHFPRMPPGVFEKEVVRWVGQGGPKPAKLPIWEGECPLPPPKGGRRNTTGWQEYLGVLVNHGALHYVLPIHNDQSMTCWKEAERLVKEDLEDLEGGSSEYLDNILDVASGNIVAMRNKEMIPFSLPREKLDKLIRATITGEVGGKEGGGIKLLPTVKKGGTKATGSGTGTATATAASTKPPPTTSGSRAASTPSPTKSSPPKATPIPTPPSPPARIPGFIGDTAYSPISLECTCWAEDTEEEGEEGENEEMGRANFKGIGSLADFGIESGGWWDEVLEGDEDEVMVGGKIGGPGGGGMAAASKKARAGSKYSILFQGLRGLIHSYSVVLDGLMGGMRGLLAERKSEGGGGKFSSISMDFLPVPPYRTSWVKGYGSSASSSSGGGGGDQGATSDSGMKATFHVFRRDPPPQDFIMPPLLLMHKPTTTTTTAATKWAPTPASPQCPRVIVRYFYPLDLSPHPCPGGKVLVFGTVEHDASINVQSYQQSTPTLPPAFWGALPPTVHIITPSLWSAQGFLRHGLPPTRLTVIPHGVNTSLFFPAPSLASRTSIRESLGWDDSCVVILSVGHMRWVKGADALLFGVLGGVLELAREGGPCVRLVLKGQDSLYGAGGEVKRLLDTLGVERVRVGKKGNTTVPLREEFQALATQGRLYLDFLGKDMSAMEMGDLMRGADLYLSPYRAEGFNLPVLEAAACGLPLVVTKGGATDEFTHPSFTRYVDSERVVGGIHEHTPSPFSLHLEPSAEALSDVVVQVVKDKAWRRRAAKAAAQWVKKQGYTWEHKAKEHVKLAFPEVGGGL